MPRDLTLEYDDSAVGDAQLELVRSCQDNQQRLAQVLAQVDLTIKDARRALMPPRHAGPGRPKKRLFTYKEVAEFIGVSERRALVLAHEGKLTLEHIFERRIELLEKLERGK
jgi:hypothetical protein